jgi:hypothetical protein
MEENSPSCGRVFGSSLAAFAAAFGAEAPCAAGESARASNPAPKKKSSISTHACEAQHPARRDVSKVPPQAPIDELLVMNSRR